MKKLILIVFILSGACSPRPSLVGVWKAGNYSTWERANEFLGMTALGRANKLVLGADSSWRLEGTCEVISGSKWKISEDSLELFPDTSWGVNNAALNRSKSAFFGGYITYKINRHSLERRCDASYPELDKHDSLIKRKITFLEKLEPSK